MAPDYVLRTRKLVEPLAKEIARAVRHMNGADPRTSPNYGRIVNVKHAKRLAGLLDSGRAAHPTERQCRDSQLSDHQVESETAR